MAIRLIALDVDGTLLTSAGEVSPAVRAAIREAVARGVHVTLATGRRLYAARAYAETLGFRLPLILHGGAVIQESSTGAVLYEDAIPPDVLREAVAISLTHGYQPVLLESPAHGGRLYTGPLAADNRATREYLIPREGVTRTDHATLPTLGNILSVAMFDDELAAAADAARRAGGRARRPHRQPDRPPRDGDRERQDLRARSLQRGLRQGQGARPPRRRRKGITLAETMVVGDYLNDLEMLTAVRDGGGIAVAMGNAEPELKAVATATVATNDDDGVAEAIHRFVLKEN